LAAMGAQPKHVNGEWSIGRLLGWTVEYLTQHRVDEPRLASEVLLAHALVCRRIDLYARFESVPAQAAVERYRDWVRRAAKHEPIAYLVGEKEFFSLAFHVSPAVLIPRPETETLVEAVLDHCRQGGLTAPELWDLGTGSGCIAVALLVHLPAARVVASDLSPEALAVARANAESHGVAGRLVTAEADGVSLSAPVVPAGGFDVIVSNPPYIAALEVEELDECVRRYEPRRALTDGNDGLDLFRALGAEASRFLRPDGVVAVEVGGGQADEAAAAVERAGELTLRRRCRDRVSGQVRGLVFGWTARPEEQTRGTV